MQQSARLRAQRWPAPFVQKNFYPFFWSIDMHDFTIRSDCGTQMYVANWTHPLASWSLSKR
jgi:hypothetical protein